MKWVLLFDKIKCLDCGDTLSLPVTTINLSKPERIGYRCDECACDYYETLVEEE